MKNHFLLLSIFLMSIATLYSQERTGHDFFKSKQQLTPELIALYEQSKSWDEASITAEEIEANRLAIKAEWMKINPEIANLYKPIDTQGKLPEIIENVEINGLHSTGDEERRDYNPTAQNRWGTDIRIFEGFVDGGVDTVTDNLGDIYTLHYESFDTTHIIYVHKSTDQGDTWTLFDEVTITAPILQSQLVSIHGSGDNYILVYFLTDTGTFQALRWNTTTGDDREAEVIAPDVEEFSVGRNYPNNTNAQRVFGVYKKSSGWAVSARSTAGSYGFDWVDESPDIVTTNMLEFAYGRGGACYFTSVGDSSSNLFVDFNENFNDPMSWGGFDRLELGSDFEIKDPTIVAGRNNFENDNVFVFASARTAGTTENFEGRRYRRVNNGDFSDGIQFSAGGFNFNILHPDSYIRFQNGVVTARLSYVREVIDNSQNNQNRSLTYDGVELESFEPVGDDNNNVFPEFKSATAEINSTNEPFLIFAGTSPGGTFGLNLYFDKESSTLNNIEFDLSRMIVYPNPLTDKLIISSPDKVIEQVKVFNYLGQLVKEKSSEDLEVVLEMSDLSKGLYVVEILSEGQLETHKVIKK